MDEGDLLPARQVAEEEKPDLAPPLKSVALGLEHLREKQRYWHD